MHGQCRLVLAATALLVLLAHVPTIAAECCGFEYTYFQPTMNAATSYVYRCADCTRVRKHYCGVAGGGGCNMFGCNCGGGCIRGVPGRSCSYYCCDKRQDRLDRRARRELDSAAISPLAGNYTGHDVIVAADLDKNGHLDEVEVHLYLTQRGVLVDDVTGWQELDSNNDGKLTAAEIDNDLRGSDDVTAA